MKAKPFLLIFSLFLFVSCSQESLYLKECHSYIIYDYKNQTQLPSQTLSVFVSTNVDVRKLDEINVFDSSSHFYWQTQDLFRFSTGEKNYAGCPSFKLPEGDVFSNGAYDIKLITKDGEKIEYRFSLNYKNDFLTQKAGEAESLCKNLGAVEYLTVYDENKKLLFFGKKSDDFQTGKDIWLKYNNAASYNNVYCLENNSVYVVMPSQNVESGE